MFYAGLHLGRYDARFVACDASGGHNDIIVVIVGDSLDHIRFATTPSSPGSSCVVSITPPSTSQHRYPCPLTEVHVPQLALLLHLVFPLPVQQLDDIRSQ